MPKELQDRPEAPLQLTRRDGSTAPSWGEKRGSWPPFEPGNTAAEKHGALSERRWRPEAERLAALVIAEAPWLIRPAFRWAVEAWAVTQAKAVMVDRWLNEHGLLDEEGIPYPANALADKLHSRAITLRGQLGLDPVAFAKLLATFAAVPGTEEGLEALKAEGRRLIQARALSEVEQ